MQRTYLALAVLLLAPPVLANSLLEGSWPGMRPPPVAPPPLPPSREALAPTGVVSLEVIPYREPAGDS